jgi:hypothetical protein
VQSDVRLYNSWRDYLELAGDPLMRSFFLSVALCVTLIGSAFAQGGMMPGPGTFHNTGSSFTGVGDVETTIVHFWGLVAASSAKATANVVAADLCSATGCSAANSCTGVKVLATGKLDLTGNYCGTSSANSVTSWCTSPATCTAGGTARVTKLYNQIGTGNATAASYAVAPGFVLSAFNSQPAMLCDTARTTIMTATIVAIPAPWSAGATFERTGGFTSFSAFLSDTGNTLYFGGNGTANQVQAEVLGSSDIIVSATDGSSTSDFSHPHSSLFAIPAGASSNGNLYVDGAAGTPAATSNSNLGTAIALCGYSGNVFTGYQTRWWLDNTTVNSTTANNVTKLTTVPLP